MIQRTVILHYHLFKNAGTSVDGVLKDNFPGGWVTREFPASGGDNSALIADWIRGTPDGIAFSTHTGVGPVPQIPGVRILSVMFLRDPIDRIRSAYRFERKQQADTFGARLAKETDLEGYVRGRLNLRGDRQCRNFQTERLASMVPGPEPELARAKAALSQLTVVGKVSDFGASMEALTRAVRPYFPLFSAQSVHLNRSMNGHAHKGEGLAPELETLLTENNRDDLEILQTV